MRRKPKIDGLFRIVILLIAMTAGLAAQEAPEAPVKPLRFDVTALGGYRTPITFGGGTDAQGNPNLGLVVDSSPSYGAAFGFRIDEEDLVEFRWARQDSRIHFEGVPGSTGSRVVLDQFHGDFTREYILEDWHTWARPFVMGSVGATHLSGGATSSSFTRFSFGLGGGVKFFVNRRFGFRVQAEWLPIWVSPEVQGVCGPGCVVHVGGTLSSQGEVVVGPFLRF